MRAHVAARHVVAGDQSRWLDILILILTRITLLLRVMMTRVDLITMISVGYEILLGGEIQVCLVVEVVVLGDRHCAGLECCRITGMLLVTLLSRIQGLYFVAGSSAASSTPEW